MDMVIPEAAGFSSERLMRIRPVLQRYVDEKKLAGILSLIARGGKIVHCEKVGWADIEAVKPMQEDTIFRIYSMSKPITTTAVMMLYEEGRFRLTDPVWQYIPAFKDLKVLDNTAGSGVRYVPLNRPITIHDLLTHTAGLSYGFEDNVYIDELVRKNVWAVMDTKPDVTLEEMIGFITQLPLANQPGTFFRYSLATDVLGYLVQLVAGRPFEDFLKQCIFEPLGMVDTAFYVPAEKVGRFSAVYGPDEKLGLKVVDPVNNPKSLNPPTCCSGGGGLVSTAGDYLRFCQMLLNGGELEGTRLLGRKTVELMMTNNLPKGVLLDDGSGFGLGGAVVLDLGLTKGLGSAGTYTWGGAANTNFWIDPKEDLIGILMLQFMPGDTYPVVADFHTLTYQAMV